jgi:magnesium chelatase subunit D
VAAEDRALIVGSRLRFDADPVEFCASFEDEQQRLRQAIVEARSLIASIKPSGEILENISQAVTDAGVRSLRADLAALRASSRTRRWPAARKWFLKISSLYCL